VSAGLLSLHRLVVADTLRHKGSAVDPRSARTYSLAFDLRRNQLYVVLLVPSCCLRCRRYCRQLVAGLPEPASSAVTAVAAAAARYGVTVLPSG
jgi:hypothetical protein